MAATERIAGIEKQLDELLALVRYERDMGAAYLAITGLHSAFFYRNEHGPALVDAIPELAPLRDRIFALSQEAARINHELWQIERRREQALVADAPAPPA